MPLKASIVKTYGRHKFRRVKSDLWVSPESDRDEIFRSPVAKKERIPSRFEDTSNCRKPRNKLWAQPLGTCTNITKSTWDLPRKKASITCSQSGKENSTGRNQKKRDEKPRNDNVTTPAISRKGLSKRTHCVMSEKSVEETSHDKKLNLLYDTPEKDEDSSKSLMYMYVPDSYDSFKKNESLETSSCDDSYKTDKLRYHGNNQHVSVISISSDESSFCRAKSVHFSPSALFLNGSALVSPLVSNKVTSCGSEPNGGQYITSTPLDAIVSRSYFKICDMSGGGRPASTSQESSMAISNCQVVIQPLRITPTLQRSSDYAMTKLHSLEVQGNSNPAVLEEDKHEVPYSPDSPPSSKILSLPKQNGEASLTSAGENVNSQQRLLLKECVVSLEKLKLTPLINERKRLMSAAYSGPFAQSNIIQSPQRSHLSFMEALTPARKSTHADIEGKSGQDKLVSTPLEKVLMECDQDKPITFRQYLKPSVLSKCVKVGEGVYGEVFKTTNTKRQQVALKIIPVEGDFPVNGEAQKTFDEMLPEIVISKELSALSEQEQEPEENTTPNFICVHKVSCCQGKYPAKLLKQWDKWDNENGSDNDRPDFPDDQLFIVFEFANGGRDLEHFEFNSPSEALSVLHQTALSLAVAENALEFEHRDLHWGNVLVAKTAHDTAEYRLNGEDVSLHTHGVFVSVIDFTLSRLNKENLTVFGNLAEDESLFTGKGDYQFDIYRLMRKANKNEWEHFEPHTNVLWLHYLADKMLKNKRYALQERDVEAKMRRFLRQARRYKSATEMLEDGMLS